MELPRERPASGILNVADKGGSEEGSLELGAGAGGGTLVGGGAGGGRFDKALGRPSRVGVVTTDMRLEGADEPFW